MRKGTGREAVSQAGASSGAETLGVRLREAREHAGISVRELARRIGVSASLVSQIERGRVMPSVGTLFAIANLLGLVIDDLFKGEGRTPGAPLVPARVGPIQRHHNREAIQMAAGVRWERLTAQPDHDVEFLYVVYEPGAESCKEDALFQHGGSEYVYLISGRLGVRIGFDTYELGPGDSMSFNAQRPHRLWCSGREPAIGIFTIIHRTGDTRQPIAAP